MWILIVYLINNLLPLMGVNNSLFDLKNYTIITTSLSDEESLFGFDFQVLIDQAKNTSSILVGAPRELCRPNTIRCGALYICPLPPDPSSSGCKLLESVYEAFDGVFENDFLGYHLEHHSHWGTLVCAPLKQRVENGTKALRGWCGKLDHNFNVVTSVRGEASLGFSSVYLDFYGGLGISDPLAFGGRGLLHTLDRNFSKKGAKLLGFVQNGYPGFTMCSLKLDDDKEKSYILYSGQGRTGDALFLMELRKSQTKKGKIGSLVLAQVTRLPKFTDDFDTQNSQEGFDFLSSDLDGDGWDDVLIAAPYSYSDRGRVFQLFSSRDKRNRFSAFKKRGTLMGDNQEGCLFGYSMTVIGDVNLDGINDIAVSAPFCEKTKGGGAVYIYLSKRGQTFSDPYYEKIWEEQFNIPLLSFGMRLKSGFDIDNDKRFSLVIAAPLSNKIVLLRRKPVTTLRLYINNRQERIKETSGNKCVDSSGKTVLCVPIKLCLKVLTEFPVDQLSYKLNLSISLPKDKRGFILETNNSVNFKTSFLAKPQNMNCVTTFMGFKRPFREYNKPIVFVATYGVEIDPHGAENPILMYQSNNPSVITFKYYKNCYYQNACKSEFVLVPKVSLSSQNYSFLLGAKRKINYSFDVIQRGEPAYEATLIISHSFKIEVISFDCKVITNELSIERKPLNVYNCSNKTDDMNHTIALPTVMSKEDRVSVYVSFRIKNSLKKTVPLSLRIQVHCDSDINTKKNMIELNFVAKSSYKLGLSAHIQPNFLNFNSLNSSNTFKNKDDSYKIIHLSYLIDNSGPSNAGNVMLAIYMPYRIRGSTLIWVSGLELTGASVCDYKSYHNPNLMNSSLPLISNSIGVGSEKNKEILLEISCRISQIISGTKVKITLELALFPNITSILHPNETTLIFRALLDGKKSTVIGLPVVTVSKSGKQERSKMYLWFLIIPLIAGIGGIVIILLYFHYLFKRFRTSRTVKFVDSYKRLLSVSNV